jgi:hypothetical protein
MKIKTKITLKTMTRMEQQGKIQTNDPSSPKFQIFAPVRVFSRRKTKYKIFLDTHPVNYSHEQFF